MAWVETHFFPIHIGYNVRVLIEVKEKETTTGGPGASARGAFAGAFAVRSRRRPGLFGATPLEDRVPGPLLGTSRTHENDHSYTV